MGKLEELRRQVSRLKATVSARDKTIASLRQDLQGAGDRARRLEGALQEIADGLEPLEGVPAKLAHVMGVPPDTVLPGIDRYGELLALAIEGSLLSDLRELTTFPDSGLGSPGASHEGFGARLQQALEQMVDETEAMAAALPDPPDLQLKALLARVTYLIEAAPPVILARLGELWESTRLFDWLTASRETLESADMRVARLEAIISVCETFMASLAIEVEFGGKAAFAWVAALGAGAALTVMSLTNGTLGFIVLMLKARIILIEAEAARLPD